MGYACATTRNPSVATLKLLPVFCTLWLHHKLFLLLSAFFSVFSLGSFVTQYFTFKYPNLDANNTVCGLSFSQRIIYICAKSLKWNTAFTIPFCTSNF